MLTLASLQAQHKRKCVLLFTTFLIFKNKIKEYSGLNQLVSCIHILIPSCSDLKVFSAQTIPSFIRVQKLQMKLLFIYS